MSAPHAASPPTTHGAGHRRAAPAFALAAALLGFFVITFDTSVVNVALPAVHSDLGGGMSGLQWVMDGYALAFAAVLLSAGSMSDRVGARRAFAMGLAVFVASSTVCGPAPDLATLVIARVVQGLGAAMMTPSSRTLIREGYSDPVERGRAIALWTVGGAVAAAAGPVTGGALSLISWRMIFFINLPVGVAAVVLLVRVARSAGREVPHDRTGQIAAVTAMGALTYGVIEVGADGLGAPRVLVSLTVTALALAVFVTAQPASQRAKTSCRPRRTGATS
ncbi:MFS transporter [Streptomyces sp. NPDC090499]|uniref:MFS transporter n=1 Tax=unclassified Streptomyces TaxID=2593676 RepID=UPI0037F2127E